MTNGQSLFAQKLEPYKQALIVFGIAIIFQFANYILSPPNPSLPWMLVGAFLLFFGIFNSVFSLTADSINKYWGQSILCYIGLVLAMGGIAWAISGQTLSETGTFQIIFMILTFGYLVFLSIMGLIKRLISFFNAEEEKKLTGKGRKKRRRVVRRKIKKED